MAAFNFPNSPSTNDIHNENGVSWKWNGSVWKKIGTVANQLSQLGVTGISTLTGGINVGTAGTISSVGNLTFDKPGAGIITATKYYGDGSTLSNITSTTINNNADNRVITGSGTANTLNGEANLTFDGSDLSLRATKANLIVAKTGLTVKSNSDIAATYDLIQLGAGGALASYSTATATADTQFIHNAYRHSGNNWKYRYADTAMRLRMNSPGGAFIFESAASGSADADITFSEKVRITSGGVVQIGSATANSADIDTSNTKLTIKQSANSREDGIYIERSGERRGWYQYVGGGLSTNDALCFDTNQLGTDTSVLALDRDGTVKIGANKLRIEPGAVARAIDVVTTHGSGGEVASFQNSDSGNYGGLVVSGGETDRECRLESAFGSSFMTFYTQTASAEGERMRITSAGKILINNTASNTMWGYGQAGLQLTGNWDEASASFINDEANSNSHAITLAKIRGSSIVNSGDICGAISWNGYDGSAYKPTARIMGAVDGTPGSGDMPGRLVFETTNDGGSTPIERMRITSAGNVLISGASAMSTLSITDRSFVLNTGGSTGAYIGMRGTNSNQPWVSATVPLLSIGTDGTGWPADSSTHSNKLVNIGIGGGANGSSSTVEYSHVQIQLNGTIRSHNGVQSGGNSTGGYELSSQYSGKGYAMRCQYATSANGGSGGTDPVFEGWWGATNTFRVNTNGKLRVNGINYIEAADFRVQNEGSSWIPSNGGDMRFQQRINSNTSLISLTNNAERITFSKACHVLVTVSQDILGNTDTGYWYIMPKVNGTWQSYQLVRKTTQWDNLMMTQYMQVPANGYIHFGCYFTNVTGLNIDWGSWAVTAWPNLS